MENIIFEERAVAFVDILGFSSLVVGAATDTEAMNQLNALVDLLTSAVPTLNKTVDSTVPKHLIPRHNYISDSIILSAPISCNDVKSYNGLVILAMRIIQLTHHFLNEGYLLRGGLTIGQVWHSDTNIVGPAYQEAYSLEKNGDDPCVVLSPGAADMWNQRKREVSRMCIRKPHQKRSICTKKEVPIIVNGLHDFYIPQNTQHGAIDRRYLEYSQIVNKNIAAALPESAKKKWLWFKQYLEAESSEAAVQHKNYYIKMSNEQTQEDKDIRLGFDKAKYGFNQEDLESKGERVVRDELNSDKYGTTNLETYQYVEAWLADKEFVRTRDEEAKRSAREEETLSIAKSANKIARSSKNISLIAAAAAIIAAIFAVIAAMEGN